MAGKAFKVSFTLDEADANYFRGLFRKAKKHAADEAYSVPYDTRLAANVKQVSDRRGRGVRCAHHLVRAVRCRLPYIGFSSIVRS